ncbi:MAG: ATP-binding protein [Chloroflexi bacterium]|nr:ATP-binding protein [Chloroflexota bacterium]
METGQDQLTAPGTRNTGALGRRGEDAVAPAIGYVTGESTPAGFSFVSSEELVPPRLEYVVVAGMRERRGDTTVTVDLLAQVTNVKADVITLDDRIDFLGAETVLNHRVTFPPRLRVEASVVGYLDGDQQTVRAARNAVLPGTRVHLAPDDLLRKFFSRTSGSCITLGTLMNRRNVEVALDPNGLSRHLAIIAQTGAGKSYLAGKVLEELLGLGATIVVLDPNSDYVQLRKLREDDAIPYEHARKAPNHDRIQLYRVPIAGRQRYPDALCGPSSKYTIRFFGLDGEEICDVAGVPSSAERIREAVVNACIRLRRDRVDFNPRFLAQHLADFAGIPLEDLDDQVTGPGAVATITQGPDLEDADAELDRLRATDHVTTVAVTKRGRSTTHAGTHDDREMVAARNALRYIRKLEKYPIWSQSTIDLNAILQPMKLTVLDLAGTEKGVMAYTAEWLLSNLWQRALGGELSNPVFVVLEEAHTLVPGGRETTRASRIINTVASEGRKFGVFLIVVTQRPSKISDDTLSQCASQLIMRLTNPDDQKAIQRASEVVSQALLDDLPGLNQGEVVVLGRLTRVPAMVRVGGRVGAEGGADINLVERFERARKEVEDERFAARRTPPRIVAPIKRQPFS